MITPFCKGQLIHKNQVRSDKTASSHQANKEMTFHVNMLLENVCINHLKVHFTIELQPQLVLNLFLNSHYFGAERERISIFTPV